MQPTLLPDCRLGSGGQVAGARGGGRLGERLLRWFRVGALGRGALEEGH